MKKRIFALTVVIICLSILTGTTLAYFTTSDTARNVITSAGVDIIIVEQQKVGDELTGYPTDPVPVIPGKEVSKIVSIQSLEKEVWIRAEFEAVFYAADGSVMDVDPDEVLSIVMSENSGWSYKDGWWYYAEPIGGGEYTDSLFEVLRFAGPEMGNEFQGSKVKVFVNAQAVQYANNGSTVFEANGWSEET